jgi:hypothetical protein
MAALLPSGSVVVKPIVWARGSRYPGMDMPLGTLVRVLPLGGPLWYDRLCIFLGWHDMKYNSYPWCRIADSRGEAVVPRQALDVVAYPSGSYYY